MRDPHPRNGQGDLRGRRRPVKRLHSLEGQRYLSKDGPTKTVQRFCDSDTRKKKGVKMDGANLKHRDTFSLCDDDQAASSCATQTTRARPDFFAR